MNQQLNQGALEVEIATLKQHKWEMLDAMAEYRGHLIGIRNLAGEWNPDTSSDPEKLEKIYKAAQTALSSNTKQW